MTAILPALSILDRYRLQLRLMMSLGIDPEIREAAARNVRAVDGHLKQGHTLEVAWGLAAAELVGAAPEPEIR
jgi:hypothetical protein